MRSESGSAPASGAANGALAVGIPARGAPRMVCPPGAEFGARRAEQQPRRLRSPSSTASFRLSREDVQQIPQLALHLVRCADGVGDFFAQQLAVALTQALDGFASGGFGQAQ